MAGHAWVDASHKAQNLNPGRAQKLYHFIVNDYFAKLQITMEKVGVMNKPGCFMMWMKKDVVCAFTNNINCTHGLKKC